MQLPQFPTCRTRVFGQIRVGFHCALPVQAALGWRYRAAALTAPLAPVSSTLERSRKRPDYAVVTGVSSGALMAPFAFAGSKYDAALRAAYTKSAQRTFSRSAVPEKASSIPAAEGSDRERDYA